MSSCRREVSIASMSAVAGARPAQSLLLSPRRRARRDRACGYGGGVRWTCGRQRMTDPLSLSNEAAKGWRKTETRRRRLPLHSSATADGARAVDPRSRSRRSGRAERYAGRKASPLVLSLRLGATYHSEGREGDVT